jgi:hypothetical protein
MAKRHGKHRSEKMKQQNSADVKEVRSSQTFAETTANLAVPGRTVETLHDHLWSHCASVRVIS